MKERGFILQGQLLLYGGIAIGVLVLGLLAALKIQTSRLEAEQAKLAACAAQYQQALASIARQNQAVLDMEKAGQEARRAAQEAQDRAKAAQKGLVKERERLAALKPTAGPCPSGEAVKRVREGLGK